MPEDPYTDDPNVLPKDRDPLEIEIILTPKDAEEGFTADEHAIFSEHFDIANDGREKLSINLHTGGTGTVRNFVQKYVFKKGRGWG